MSVSGDQPHIVWKRVNSKIVEENFKKKTKIKDSAQEGKFFSSIFSPFQNPPDNSWRHGMNQSPKCTEQPTSSNPERPQEML